MLNLFWNFLQILALVTLLAMGITSCSDQEASDTTASSTSSDNQTTSSETSTQVCSDELGTDAVADDCGICDSDPNNNCTLRVLPQNGSVGASWEPEIGIRIELNEPSLSLAGVSVSGTATALTMSESNGGAVAGESKIFVDEKSREVLLSFIPAAPLYGNYTYKVNLNQNVLLNLGISSVNLSQALKNGGLFQGEKSVWTFKTAETTRFVLPVLFEYDDTICHCNDASGSAGPNPCKSLSNSQSNRQFTVPGLCYSAEDVNDIVFGNQNHQISGYWSSMSQGRLVLSKVRTKDGRLLGTHHFLREGIKGKDYTTSNTFRNSEEENAIATISKSVDFDRYALLKTPEGKLNVLSPYMPDRAFIASRVENGYYKHFNVYMMNIYGNPENFDFGSSSAPSSSNADLNASLSHQDYYYGSYKWLHETGHGFFGMKDLYYDSQFPGTGGVFGIMGNHYANKVPPQTSDAWHTIIAEIALLQEPYDATDVKNILAKKTADASCGTAENTCHLKARYTDGEIWKFPAVIENDEVVGHYFVEMYGRNGNDANLEFQGVDYGIHPGVISVWKTDESTQKILDHICYFSGCNVDRFQSRSSRWEKPEYYPSCPHVMPTEYLSRTPIYKTFPWWEYEKMPYVTKKTADVPLTKMPREINLPVVQVPTYGKSSEGVILDCDNKSKSVMDPACRFGGGMKIGTITLGFDSTINKLESAIAGSPLERNAYLLPKDIPFTLSFVPASPEKSMTYADHILPQHKKYISTSTDDYCGQILADGFLKPK